MTKHIDFEARRADIELSIEHAAFIQYVGAELVHLAYGHATMQVKRRPQLLQNGGFFHGGMVSMMFDCTAAVAASTILPSIIEDYVVTAEFKINMFSPADGERLICRADVLKPGRTLIVVEAKLAVITEDGTEKPVAAGLGTMARTRRPKPL